MTFYNDSINFGLVDVPLIFLSAMYFGLIATASLKIVKNCFKKTLKPKLRHLIQETDNPREVIIVRGVPGVGKDRFVRYLEDGNDEAYSVLSTDDYFMENDKFVFDRTLVNNADAYCFSQFHTNLQFLVPKIYVTNVNNKLWMYSNYVKLARSYGYKVRVVEIICRNEDELKYFNSRSRHNVPMTYSKKVFSEWENDQIAQYYEPFFGNEKGSLSGDCLPFPKVTKDQLDKELDDYFETKNKCAIETDDESEEMVNSDELDKLSQSLGCVEIMDNDDFKEVNERLVKITTRTHRNQKNKLVYQIEMGDGFDKIIRNSKHSHYSESY